jgi:hypothetical protein
MRVFTFSQTWHVPATVEPVYQALADVDRYPTWWPQVREVERIDERSGHARVRSLLPYTLNLVLTREIEDPTTQLLRVQITGDLDGWSQWQLEASPAGTTAHYTQQATVTARGLEHLVPLASPILRANHSWMMSAGERGLRAFLESEPPAGDAGTDG